MEVDYLYALYPFINLIVIMLCQLMEYQSLSLLCMSVTTEKYNNTSHY
jgi:hypothetical protein